MKKLPLSSFRRLIHQKMTPSKTRTISPMTHPSIMPSFLSVRPPALFGSSAAAPVADGDTAATFVEGVIEEDGVADVDSVDCDDVDVMSEGPLYVVPPMTIGEGHVNAETPSIEVDG